MAWRMQSSAYLGIVADIAPADSPASSPDGSTIITIEALTIAAD